jgi:trans-aconitate methyltransferase
VDMQGIFDGIDNGALTTVRKAIEAKDSKQFAASYKNLLEECYSCHKAALRPYLRPMVPVSGAQPIINLDPAATWPQ